VITCNRCGKENQDHYKFCLGCGNEIRASKTAAPPSPAPARPPSAALDIPTASLEEALLGTPAPATASGGGLAMAPTMVPPPPDAMIQPPAATPDATSDPGQRPLPGMSAAPAPAATPPPTSKPSGGIPWNDSPKMPAKPAGAPVAAAPAPAPAPRPAPAAAPAAAAPAPAGLTKCPSCGADVKAGFAFCGSCGTRVSAPPAAARPAAAPAPAPAAPAPSTQPRGRLVLIRPDGSEGGVHPLHDGENLIGRGQGSLFDADAYLSPRHAEFVIDGPTMLVRDLRSLNGVFLKITQEEPLVSGDIFRIGQELLRFDVIAPPAPLEDGTEIMGTPNPGYWGRLSVIVGRDVDGSAFPVFGEALVLGRERGDIVFPEDGYVSGTHARISLREAPGGHQPILADLGSSNGTFLRLRGERAITNSTFVLMGQQLFRVELR